jgi:hypothetical protein
MAEGSEFTLEQFHAARFLVARLRAEAAHDTFYPSDIGMKFTPAGDVPAALVDDGTIVAVSDFMRAALTILWSLVLDLANEGDLEPGEVVQMIGLSIAEQEPLTN